MIQSKKIVVCLYRELERIGCQTMEYSVFPHPRRLSPWYNDFFPSSKYDTRTSSQFECANQNFSVMHKVRTNSGIIVG
jgi:hypothetical protein